MFAEQLHSRWSTIQWLATLWPYSQRQERQHTDNKGLANIKLIPFCTKSLHMKHLMNFQVCQYCLEENIHITNVFIVLKHFVCIFLGTHFYAVLTILPCLFYLQLLPFLEAHVFQHFTLTIFHVSICTFSWPDLIKFTFQIFLFAVSQPVALYIGRLCNFFEPIWS